MGNGLYNALVHYKSIAVSHSSRVSATAMDADLRSDLQRGLEIIESRSASLHRFLEAYRGLAQMPPPVLREVQLAPLVARVVGLETRITVFLQPVPYVAFQAYPDQLEQMLISLVRNAAHAVLETRGAATSQHLPTAASDGVVVRCQADGDEGTLAIEDEGAGL